MSVGIGVCFKSKEDIFNDARSIRVAIARILKNKKPKEMEEALAAIDIQMANLEDLAKEL